MVAIVCIILKDRFFIHMTIYQYHCEMMCYNAFNAPIFFFKKKHPVIFVQFFFTHITLLTDNFEKLLPNSLKTTVLTRHAGLNTPHRVWPGYSIYAPFT